MLRSARALIPPCSPGTPMQSRTLHVLVDTPCRRMECRGKPSKPVTLKRRCRGTLGNWSGTEPVPKQYPPAIAWHHPQTASKSPTNRQRDCTKFPTLYASSAYRRPVQTVTQCHILDPSPFLATGIIQRFPAMFGTPYLVSPVEIGPYPRHRSTCVVLS